METYYLVKFEDNWADEMNIYGFKLFKNDEFEILQKKISSITGSIVIGFGTNQDNEYDDYNDLLNCFEIIPISLEKYNLLMELFPYGEFGETSVFDNDMYD